MQKLLNTLYITEPDASLRLKGEALSVVQKGGQKCHIPLHQLEQIVSFSYAPATLPLMTACARRGIGLAFLNQSGHLRFRVVGKSRGTAALRRAQYTISEAAALELAKQTLQGKFLNSTQTISHFRRNHPERAQMELAAAEKTLKTAVQDAADAVSLSELRGIEGNAAHLYFQVLGHMILKQEPELQFSGRNRRPPKDRCNAMLSYAYSLLTNECVHALECAGLDPDVGFFHGERPGKPALALDLMEEFRAPIADRTVLALINLGMVRPDMFEIGEDEGVYLAEAGRKILLKEWNRRRWQEIEVPELGQKIPQGLLPHLAAKKLAAYLRGELPAYQPIRWR